MTDEQRQRVAIAKTIRDKFDEQKTVCERQGDRIFVRFVDWRDKDNIGWNDWTLAGVVSKEGAVSWSWADGMDTNIAEEIADGVAGGRIEVDAEYVIWWCRSKLDGPPGERFADAFQPKGKP